MIKPLADLPPADQHLIETCLAVDGLVSNLSETELLQWLDTDDVSMFPTLLPGMYRTLRHMHQLLRTQRADVEQLHEMALHRNTPCEECGARPDQWRVRWDVGQQEWMWRCKGCGANTQEKEE